MSDTFKLVVSSPEGNLFEDNVYFISLRGEMGDLAILKDHIPFSTTVKPCTIKIEPENGDDMYADIESGILTVSKEETILLSTSLKWKNQKKS